MQSLSHFPHEIKTRYHAVLLYRSGRHAIKHVTRKYHISKASLMRWNKQFDGTKESLLDKSHRPHTQHPSSHTSEEIKKIVDLMKRNPDIGLNELFSKLRLSIGYARHPVSLYRWLKTNDYYGIVKVKQTPYTPKPCKTPEVLGEKWQIERSHRNDNNRFYSTLKFYNYNDLVKQMKAYLVRSNNICSSSIWWLTTLQKRDQLIKKGMIA